MYLRQQSTSAYPIPILLVSGTDHVTPLGAGVTPVVNLRKNGAAAATAAGTITATDAGGVAYLSGNAVDRNTLGSLVLEVTAAGADPVAINYTIVPWDPFDAARLGLTSFPASPSGQVGGVATLIENDGGQVGVRLVMIADTSVTSSAVVAIDFADTVATRANQTTAQTSLNTLTTTATAIKGKTDQLTFVNGYNAVQVRGADTGVFTLSKFSGVFPTNFPLMSIDLGGLVSLPAAYDAAKTAASQTSVDDVAAQVEAVNSELIDQGTTLDAALAAAQGAETNTTDVPGLLEDDGTGGKRYKASVFSQLQIGDSGAGDGDTEVDEDTGGAGNLRYVDSAGTGIANASIIAYLKSDYDAGNYTRRGRTVTDDDGNWVAPLMLNSGLAYTIRFEVPGEYGPDTREVTIP